MKNMLKWHENVMIFPLKFSQDFNGFWFHSASTCGLILTLFMLVQCRCVDLAAEPKENCLDSEVKLSVKLSVI